VVFVPGAPGPGELLQGGGLLALTPADPARLASPALLASPIVAAQPALVRAAVPLAPTARMRQIRRG
jgi:hypothetical protein